MLRETNNEGKNHGWIYNEENGSDESSPDYPVVWIPHVRAVFDGEAG
jgi:hypothetical protein